MRLHRLLGCEVERMTRRVDLAADTQAAELSWTSGAGLIRKFLDEHFPIPTRH